MKAVNAECCDQKSEDCSSGEPATCNAGCEAVLVPALQKCQADFFALPEMAMAMAPAKQALKHAAAKCPQEPEPEPEPLPAPRCPAGATMYFCERVSGLIGRQWYRVIEVPCIVIY